MQFGRIEFTEFNSIQTTGYVKKEESTGWKRKEDVLKRI